MSGQILESKNFLFTHKPAGISTHRPSAEHLGFVEWCSRKYQQDFKICHRLDKDTSGALVFAQNTQAAQALTELFENHKVEKEYWLVSHKKSEKPEWTLSGFLEKKGAHGEAPENKLGSFATTTFRRMSEEGPLYLYKAYPKTGKTHQIRIHATQSGIPILGDETYGGREFPRLMLHSNNLKFQLDGEDFLFSAKPSRLFENLDFCRDPQWASWIHGFERREILFPEFLQKDQSLRLLHTETKDLRIDKVGEICMAGWWKNENPSPEEIEKIKSFMNFIGAKHWRFQGRPVDNNKNQLENHAESEELPQQWNFKERNIQFSAALERGHNFGLFLDQRERRQWIKENSKDKKVLNLFSFTCGFSVAAALGGAQEVVSVDTSKKYLQWGRENFSLNGLDSRDHKFYDMDSFDYLAYARKKNLKFDIIVCDPPSFSRHKKSKKVFKIEKDIFDLLKACREVISENGILLFSTNFEAWDFFKWHQWIEENLQKIGFSRVESGNSQWDFEWQKREAHLKVFFLKKPCPLGS